MDQVPLSFMQEQLWFLDRANRDLRAYNIPMEMRIGGTVEVEPLRRALHVLAERHEVLRARFVAYDGRPFQVLGAPADVPLRVEDVSTLDEPERERRADELRREIAQHPFDLERRPPVVACLVRVATERWLLLLTIHHIAFDAWSYGVLLEELWRLYDGEVTGRRAELPPVAIGYGDYALWQRERLQGARLQTFVDFWRERLAGDLPVTMVPPDDEEPAVQTFAGYLLRHHWDETLARRVERFAGEHDTTPFVVTLTALFVLLHRYTGQDDVIVGVPIANREYAELEQAIGFFVNMVPVRVDLAGDPTFAEAVGRVAEAVVSAQASAGLPFSKLVEILQPERDPARSPVFQIGYTYANPAGLGVRPPPGIDRIEVAQPPDGPKQSRFSLSMTLEREPDGLVCNVEFNTDLYGLDKVERLLGHFRTLLDDGLARPAVRVSGIALLTPGEWRKLVVEFNRTGAPFPEDACIHEVFEARHAEDPARIAAVDESSSVTYGELNRRANRVARLLRARGVVDEALVGVSMRRGIDRLAAILGVLKAGAGYVPIDPTYPADRIAFMVADSRADLLLVDGSATGLPPVAADEVVDLPALAPEIAALDGDDLGLRVDPRQLAYVIYTSGSTGTPKGVVIEHRSVVNFMTSTRELFGLTPEDRVLQYASLSFDVSVFEMFAGLGAGATVALPSEDTVLSPVRLTEYLARERITVTDIPPAVMSLLEPAGLEHLRIVFVGGEAFSARLVKDWSKPGRRFFNGYGPTECTVTVIAKELGPDVQGNPPMGGPMANHEAYVVDRYLNPLPVGVPGELLVGGAGVARGYLRREALTAERFISSPAPEAAWERVYRTGDLARFVDDESLEFVGRIDSQVKVRGYRVELGEIAARLQELEDVRDAAVRVWRDQEGNARDLIAYVIPEHDELDVESVRRALGRALPSFMVPGHFVTLDAFPLTGSGKVDDAALPAVERRTGAGGAAPGDEIEEYLALEVFGPLLGLDAPAVDESFFRLGGNSLQAMQVLSRLRKELDVDVDVADLFQQPTITRFAVVLRERYGVTPQSVEARWEEPDEAPRAAQAASPSPARASRLVVELAVEAGRPPAVCVHPVSGSLAPYVPLVELLGDALGVYGLQSPATWDAPGAAGVRPSVQEMAGFYLEALRSRLGSAPRRFFGWSIGGTIAFEMARIVAADAPGVRVVLLDSSPPGEPGDHTEDAHILSFASDIAASLGLPAPTVGEDFARLGSEDKLRALADGLRAQELGDAGLLDDVLGRFEVFRRNALAAAGYVPEAPTAADVLLLRAVDSDHDTTRWQQFTAAGWRHVELPGGHYDIVRPPVTDLVATHLAGHLDPQDDGARSEGP
jgi:amino acid adenylation domain-containing protein